MSSIVHLDTVEMAAKLRARDLTAAKVLAAHRAQPEAVNPGVNAVVALDWGAVEQRVDELDAMAAQGTFAGVLHGMLDGLHNTNPKRPGANLFRFARSIERTLTGGET